MNGRLRGNHGTDTGGNDPCAVNRQTGRGNSYTDRTIRWSGVFDHVAPQGCLRKEDIEECVSDVFFELYRCRDKIDLSKGSLKTFLLTIAERQAIKYYERKTDKFDKISLQEQLEKGEEPLSDHNVEQQTIQKEESRLLIEAIKGLGEPTASIVIQKYYYGMTAKEIGQRAGLSKNAVEKRLKRGLEKLKTVLQSEHDQLT